VLFFCGLNSIRSPMAEVLAKKMLPKSIFVASAGVRTGPRDPFVDAVLAEKGLSLENWRPRRLEDPAAPLTTTRRFPFDRQVLRVRIGAFDDESVVRFAVKRELVIGLHPSLRSTTRQGRYRDRSPYIGVIARTLVDGYPRP
jgi:hypothetical protein